MGAQVLASEAVTCPALLLSCLAGLQLPLACLLLIINSVLLYAGYSRVQRSNQNRSSRQGPTSTSACLLWWRWTLVVLINPALGGAAKQKRRQAETATASAGGAHRKLGCFSRSAAQRSTAPPLGQHKVRYWAASRSQRSTASCVLPLAAAIGGDPIPDPGSRAAAGWRAQNSTTAGRALAV